MVVSLLVLSAIFSETRAQFLGVFDTRQPTHKVYVEGFGSAGLYSVNYEYTVTSGLNARIGTAFVPRIGTDYTEQVIVPVTVGYLVGSGGHHVEVGAGLTGQVYGRKRKVFDTQGGRVAHRPPRQNREILGIEYAFGLLIGYRYQVPDGGWLFRATYTPLKIRPEGWISSGGLSVGYAF